MKKKLHNKVWIVTFLTLVVAIFSLVYIGSSLSNGKIVTDVKQRSEDQKEKVVPCPDTVKADLSTSLPDKFGVDADIDDSSSSTLNVSVTPDSNDPHYDILKGVTFKVVKINGVDANSGQISFGNPYSIQLSQLKDYRLNTSDDLTIKFKATDIKIPYTNANGESYVCEGTVDFSITVDNAFGSAEDVRDPGDGDDDVGLVKAYAEADSNADPDAPVDETGVNCSNPSTDFEKSYCSIRNSSFGDNVKVENKGNITDRSIINNSGNFVGSPMQLQCSTTKINDQNVNSPDYYSNVTKMQATRIIDKPLENFAYVYHFAPGNVHKDTTKFTCKIKCTEKVEVQYGPPVATRAGLCLQYQVHAKSYVTCKTYQIPEEPIIKKGSCSPRPRCVHHKKKGKDVTKNRAGPNDEFDSCVEECDGGKYTLKCSEKCYKKVYANTNQDMLNYSDYVQSEKIDLYSEINTCKSQTSEKPFTVNKYSYGGLGSSGHNGCYYWSGGEIKWSGTSIYTPARFYSHSSSDNGGTKTDRNWNYSNYGVSGDGFIRLQKSDGLCSAKCHYSTKTCTQKFANANDSAATVVSKIKDNEYLNPVVAKKDNQANKAEYDRAVRECKAKAICNVRTATFTIVVNEKGTEVTDAQYNSSKMDSLTYDSHTGNNNGQDKNTKLSKSIFLRNFGGCYTNGSSNKISYDTTWGFKGACINTKGGLKNHVDECPGGSFYDKQYCLPLTTSKVNDRWWRWYYTKLFANGTNSSNVTDENATNSTQSSAFINECPSSWKETNISGFTPTYNIKASTRGFGYFGWKIDVNCFYAYGSIPPEDKCTGDGGGGTPNYRIRTVDLKNLFPEPKGGVTNTSAAGRAPGFNWTKFSTNILKDSKYKSNPVEYYQWIQAKSYSIYDDQYLDYQVTLTPEKLREIKGLASDASFSYASFNSSLPTEKNSVYNYKSSFLRKTLNGFVTYPDDNKLKCNNIGVNEDCESFSDVSNLGD